MDQIKRSGFVDFRGLFGQGSPVKTAKCLAMKLPSVPLSQEPFSLPKGQNVESAPPPQRTSETKACIYWKQKHQWWILKIMYHINNPEQKCPTCWASSTHVQSPLCRSLTAVHTNKQTKKLLLAHVHVLTFVSDRVRQTWIWLNTLTHSQLCKNSTDQSQASAGTKTTQQNRHQLSSLNGRVMYCRRQEHHCWRPDGFN